MAELPAPPGPKWTLPGPSRLRNEVHPESTDDERAPEEEHVQVPDSQNEIPETQPEDFVDNVDDQTCPPASPPVSPSTEAMIKKCGVAKPKVLADPTPFTSKLLSRDHLPGGHRSPSPGFIFGPARPRTNQSPMTSIGGNISPNPMHGSVASSGVDDYVYEDVQQNVPDSSHLETRSSGPAKDAEGATTRGSSSAERKQVSAAVSEPREGSHTFEHATTNITEITTHAKSSTSLSDQDNPVLNAEKKRAKLSRERGRRIHKVRSKKIAPWPPKSPRAKGPLHLKETLEEDHTIIDVSPNPASEELPQAHGECIGSSTKEMTKCPGPPQNVNRLVHNSPQAHTPGSEDRSEIFRRAPTWSAKSKPGEEVLHTLKARGRPSRIHKPPRVPRPYDVGSASELMTGGSNHFTRYPVLVNAFNTILTSMEETQVQNEQFQSAQKKEHENTITALRETINTLNGHIRNLEDTKMDLQSRTKRKSDAARDLMKYITGIQADHEKFKTETIFHRKECEKILHEKIAEIQNEKSTLEEDFSSTITAMEKSQRSMRTTLDDCFRRLEISELKRKDLADKLERDSVLAEDEKRRRTKLEEQVMTSLQTLQCYLANNQDNLLEKLSAIHTSTDRSTMKEDRDPFLDECMDALKGLRELPMQTASDIGKAEGMLRFIHESIDSKLTVLSASVDGKQFPIEDLQDYVRGQFNALKTDMLKYDEVNIKYQKAYQSSEHLTRQLEAESAKCDGLSEQLKGLRQREIDLMTWSTQLELELNHLRDAAEDHGPNHSELERELVDLRGQLRKAEDNLRGANTKFNEAEQLLQMERENAAGFKKSAGENKAKYAELKKERKREKSGEKTKNVREKVAKEYEKIYREKEATLTNNLYEVTRERDEKEKLLKVNIEELDRTREALRLAQQQIRNAESDSKGHRKEEATGEFSQHDTAFSSELDNIKEQLRCKSEAMEFKERELDAIHREYASLQTKASSLKESIGKLRVQLSEHQSNAKGIREEHDTRLNEQQHESRIALQEARNKALSLQKEKKELECSLEQSRSREISLLKNAHDEFFIERENLQTKISDIAAAKRAAEAELQQAREEASKEFKEMEKKLNTETGNLKHQLEQSILALNKADARHKRDVQGLETHENVSEQKMNEKFSEQIGSLYGILVTRGSEALAEAVRQLFGNGQPKNQGDSSEQLSAHASSQAKGTGSPSTVLSTQSEKPPSNIHAKPKRKVNRHGNSVSSNYAPYRTYPHADSAHSITSGAHAQHNHQLTDQPDTLDLYLPNDLGLREHLDEYGVSLRDLPVKMAPETQLARAGIEKLDQMMLSSTSSSQLSDYNPEIVETLGKNYTNNSLGAMGAVERSSFEEVLCKTDLRGRVTDSDSYGPSSANIPKSRANISSRLLHPEHYSGFTKTNQRQKTPLSPIPAHQSMSQKSTKTSPIQTSSPDFAHKSPTSVTKVYGYNPVKPGSSQTSHCGAAPHDNSARKRKNPKSHADYTQSFKRQKDPSQSLSSSLPQTSLPQTSLPQTSQAIISGSSQGYYPQNLKQSSQSLTEVSNRRTRRSSRINNDRYDFRYNEFSC